MRIMWSARLCQAKALNRAFGVHIGDLELRIIADPRTHAMRRELWPASPLGRSGRAWQGPVLTCFCCLPELMNVVSATTPMTDRVYTFIRSAEQLRRQGARGGRAYGRNQRARRALVAAPRPALPRRATSYPTAAESIAVLDACFPWLRGAEKPLS
jgi:hypothetical protein